MSIPKWQAHLYIHGWSVAHAATAAATAQSPEGGFVPLTAETCVAVGIFARMCGAEWTEAFVKTFVKQRFAEHAGKEILRQTAGKVPLLGNGLNGCISFGVTEAILWDVYHMCTK